MEFSSYIWEVRMVKIIVGSLEISELVGWVGGVNYRG